MPPETALLVAQKALEAAHVASTAAQVTSVQVDALRVEVRKNFVDLEARQKDFWEWITNAMNTQTKLLREQNETFDAFKSDFYVDIGRLDKQGDKHHKTIYGDPDIKEDSGLVGDNTTSKGFIRHAKIHVAIAGLLIGWFIGYLVYFYGEHMKRGVFNPSDNEWRWRVTKEVRKIVKPEALQNGNTNGHTEPN